MSINLLTIDPGNHTGWCLISKNHRMDSGHFSASGELSIYIHRMRRMFCNLVNGEIIGTPHDAVIDLCIIEGVQVYGDSLKSQTSAKRGDLVRLSYLIGMYAGICDEFSIPFHVVTAKEWKGQWTKAATIAYVKRQLNYELSGASEHEYDAVAMGLRYVEGKIKI